jgi:hypothetical protein
MNDNSVFDKPSAAAGFSRVSARIGDIGLIKGDSSVISHYSSGGGRTSDPNKFKASPSPIKLVQNP